MEYLKNVVYKFLTLPPCDERKHLVPVIDTMLKLNAEERKVMETIADGEALVHSSVRCCCCYPTPSEGWGYGGRPWAPLQGLGQRSQIDRESPKSERRKESVAGQCRMVQVSVHRRCRKDSRFCQS